MYVCVFVFVAYRAYLGGTSAPQGSMCVCVCLCVSQVGMISSDVSVSSVRRRRP